LIDLLKKKQAGEKIEAPRETPPPRVVNLMEALRASVDAGEKKAPAPRRELAGLLRRRRVGKVSRSCARATVDAMNPIELDSAALSSTVAFTGRLACMTRAEAFEVVRSHGGTPSQTVTRQTHVLVVGELGWPLLDDGRPSNKLNRAGTKRTPLS
jgi:hypothetical protein